MMKEEHSTGWIGREARATVFVPRPDGEAMALAWPTGRRDLFEAPDRYVQATRANPNFGRPGFTRDCGQRFHRGVDIAPANARPEGRTVTVLFSDCARGVEYPSDEPALAPDDEVFAVARGTVQEAVADEQASTFGRHVVLVHAWPSGAGRFATLYAHLETVEVAAGDRVEAGRRLGRMGRTSSSADARRWMAIAPHLHFEAWDGAGRPYDPLAFLRAFLVSRG